MQTPNRQQHVCSSEAAFCPSDSYSLASPAHFAFMVPFYLDVHNRTTAFNVMYDNEVMKVMKGSTAAMLLASLMSAGHHAGMQMRVVNHHFKSELTIHTLLQCLRDGVQGRPLCDNGSSSSGTSKLPGAALPLGPLPGEPSLKFSSSQCFLHLP